MTEFSQHYVDLHNKHRRAHGVADLQWSADLEKAAADYAKTCPTDHESDTDWGENLAWKANTDKNSELIQQNEASWEWAVSVRTLNRPSSPRVRVVIRGALEKLEALTVSPRIASVLVQRDLRLQLQNGGQAA